MAEQIPYSPQSGETAASSLAEFNSDEIGAVLQAEPIAAPEGFRFDIGEGDAGITLEIDFSGVGLVRVSTHATELVFSGLRPPVVVGEKRIMLQTADPESNEQMIMNISANGEIGFLLLHPNDPDPSDSSESVVIRRRWVGSHDDEQGLKSEPVTSHRDDAKTPVSSTPAREQKESDQRIELVGRITGDPRFKRSPKQGTFICEFEIVIEDDDGSELREKIVLFGVNAHKLEGLVDRALIGAGDVVAVVGYRKEYNLEPQVYGTNVRILGVG